MNQSKIFHINMFQTYFVDTTNDVASEDQMFRFDGRCGVDALLPSGAPAQCDPSGEYFCCSKYGHCGNTEEHCNCSDCVDYRNPLSKGNANSYYIKIRTHIKKVFIHFLQYHLNNFIFY